MHTISMVIFSKNHLFQLGKAYVIKIGNVDTSKKPFLH